MTGIVFGNNATLTLFNETTYGTRTNANGQKLFFTTENLKATRQTFDSQTITGDRERMKPVRGNVNVSGQIAMEVSPENMLLMLYYAIGTWTTTPTAAGSTEPFTHTFVTGSKLPSFQAQVNFGVDAPTGQRYHLFSGLKINTFSLQVPNNGNVTATFDCIGKNVVMSDSVIDSAPTTTTFTRYSSFEADIQINGSPATNVESFSLTVANELDESVYPISTDGLRTELPNGFQTVSGQFTAFFDNDLLLNSAKSGENVPIILSLKRGTETPGTSGNERMVFTLPFTMLEQTSPEVSGPGGVKLQMAFKAYKNLATAGSNIMSLVVKNTYASYKDIPDPAATPTSIPAAAATPTSS